MSHGRKNGARGPQHPASEAAARPAPLDVARLLEGRRILVTGATGFVGKVALSLLLHRYPGVGKVFVLVRPGTGGTAVDRFFGKVAPSRPFDPLRARLGERFEPFLREKVVPVAGDVSDPLLGLSPADLERLAGLDLVINSAGLVDFDPSLELALGVNVHGALHAVELCRILGAGLVHVSTCFVAGNRDGVVFEDEPIPGYFPRRVGVVPGEGKAPDLEAADFDLGTELSDAERRLKEVRAQADDRVLQSRFRERARERLREAGRPLDDEKAMRLAMGREKRLWLSGRLVELGMERARHWGWPNTYTYTKSLGEQAIAASDVPHALVRPSIVESALRYPFPGWNEGFTTSAPLAFMGLRGHRTFPMAERAILDVVPVDLVAAGVLAAAAELQERRLERARGGDVPLTARLPPGLRRREPALGAPRGGADRPLPAPLLPRPRGGEPDLEPDPGAHRAPVRPARAHYEAISTPALLALVRGARSADRRAGAALGRPPPHRAAARGRRGAGRVDAASWSRPRRSGTCTCPSSGTTATSSAAPPSARCASGSSPEDRARLPWDPEALDWRHYWMEVHMKGMEEWVFPGLDEEAGKKVHAVRAHRDLLELLDAGGGRLEGAHGAAHGRGGQGARHLRRAPGALGPGRLLPAPTPASGTGDRVLLASENRPEWAVAYFGILRAGAAAVPVDAQLSEAELLNLWRTAGARLALFSDAVAERVPELPARAAAELPGARLVLLGEALRGGVKRPSARPSPDDLASLIFTSGTTGTPKGVMLSHRNFASLVAKLVGFFDLGPGRRAALGAAAPPHLRVRRRAAGPALPRRRGGVPRRADRRPHRRGARHRARHRHDRRAGALVAAPPPHHPGAGRHGPGVVEQAFDLLRQRQRRAARLGARLEPGQAPLLAGPPQAGRTAPLPGLGGLGARPGGAGTPSASSGFDLYQGYGLTEAAPVLAVGSPEASAARQRRPGAPGRRAAHRRAGRRRRGRGAGPRAQRDDGLLARRRAAGGGRGPHRRGAGGRLAPHRRPGAARRRRQPHPGRPQEGRDHRRPTARTSTPTRSRTGTGSRRSSRSCAWSACPTGSAEKVALLVVPEYGDRPRAEVRAEVEAHLRAVSAVLPFHLRAKVWHLTDGELPRTATRKVKRRRWSRRSCSASRAPPPAAPGPAGPREERGGDAWLLDLLAEVSRRPRGSRHPRGPAPGRPGLRLAHAHRADRGAGGGRGAGPAADQLHAVQTVDDLRPAGRRARCGAATGAPRARARAAPEGRKGELQVPALAGAALGRRLLSAGQRALYRELYETRVLGEAFVPHDRNVLVVSNHASHLDMGLVKIALGEEGERLAALAARDYFFDTPLKRAYFENFTNLIPMDREGSLKASLRAAGEALRRGYHLLIFPEGTRSRDGELQPFFPTAGYLALTCGVDVLPVHLSGTFEALPAGARFPRRAPLEVRIGPVIPLARLRALADGAAGKGEGYKLATREIEAAVRALRRAARGEPEPALPDAAGTAPPDRTGPAAPREPRPAAAAAPTEEP